MTRSTFKPTYEALETRLNPGVCTVNFSLGTLTVTGSAGDDSVAISQSATGQITLKGDAATTFVVNGAPAVAGPVTLGSAASPVKNLNVNLGNGKDVVTIDEASPISLAGNVTIDLGAAPAGAIQSLTTWNASTAEATPRYFAVGGNLLVKGGTGVDSLNLRDFKVGGNLTVNGGGGADYVSLYRAAQLKANSPLCQVGGTLVVNGGAGAETVYLGDLDVQGLTTVNTFTGDPATGKNGTVTFGFAGEAMHFNGGLQVLSDVNDLGADKIVFATGALTSVGGGAMGGLNLQTYGGDDVIVVNDLINTAGTLINTGNGNDTVQIGTAGPVQFFGPVAVNLGGGNDSLTLATGGLVSFFGSASFDGGTGTNLKTVNLANVQGTVPQVLNLF